MLLHFRQGIVEAQQPTFFKVTFPYVDLIVTDTNATITFAAGNKDYLYTEQASVSNAWGPLTLDKDQWLYWDLDIRTGNRTFGITMRAPHVSRTAPTAYMDQHWFDLNTNEMKVWNGSAWVKRIRVFALKLANGRVPVSMSGLAPAFTGSQIGDNSTVYAGHILYDATTNNAIKNAEGQFVTTEDRLSTKTISLSQVKVASIIVEGEAQQNMAARTVVVFSEFGKIVHADQFVAEKPIQFGIIEVDAVVGQTINVVTQGMVSSPNWDWTPHGVNTLLYCSPSGELITEPVIPKQTPVAIVVDPHTIQLGAAVASSTESNVDVGLATNVQFGIVRLSCEAEDPLDPIVVGDNDPRWDSYVRRAGDSMTGFLTLSGDPTQTNHAATKHYVDNRSLDSLSDVVLSSPEADQVLKFDGEKWVNGQAADATNPGYRQTFVAAAGQIDFSLSQYTYVPNTGMLSVYINGIKQYPSSYTEVSSTSFRLSEPSRLNDQIMAEISAVLPPYISSGGASTLDELQDVVLTSPADDQVLMYDGTRWVNTTLTIPTPTSTLDDLTDVVVTAPVADQVLKYNGTTWVNAAAPASDVTYRYRETFEASGGVQDFTLVHSYVPNTDAVAVYVNGIRMHPGTFVETDSTHIHLVEAPVDGDEILVEISSSVLTVGGVHNLDDLDDTTITAPITGDMLAYDGSKWVNLPASLGALMFVLGDDNSTHRHYVTLPITTAATIIATGTPATVTSSTTNTHTHNVTFSYDRALGSFVVTNIASNGLDNHAWYAVNADTPTTAKTDKENVFTARNKFTLPVAAEQRAVANLSGTFTVGGDGSNSIAYNLTGDVQFDGLVVGNDWPTGSIVNIMLINASGNDRMITLHTSLVVPVGQSRSITIADGQYLMLSAWMLEINGLQYSFVAPLTFESTAG